jgi:hypothetical protein
MSAEAERAMDGGAEGTYEERKRNEGSQEGW